jgi:hypothetical protein
MLDIIKNPTANTTPITTYAAKNIQNINIIKNSTFEREILQLWRDFSTKFHYELKQRNNNANNGFVYDIEVISTFANTVDYNAVLEEFYTPYFVSINDYRANPQNSDLSKSLTSNGLKLDTLSDVAYLHYLKLLVLKVDTGAYYQGFHGDSCITIAVGNITDEAGRLIKIAEEYIQSGYRQTLDPSGKL